MKKVLKYIVMCEEKSFIEFSVVLKQNFSMILMKIWVREEKIVQENMEAHHTVELRY